MPLSRSFGPDTSFATGFVRAAPVTLRLITQRYVDSAWYNMPSSGTDASARLQAFLIDAQDKGVAVLSPGTYTIDSGACILLPPNVVLQGSRGTSVLKRAGSTIQSKPAFNFNNSGAMLALANPTTGTALAYATGRVASGTGATFNLSTSGSGPYTVSAATVVAGGTGYKVGDWISPAYAGAVLQVTAVAANRGAVTSVSVLTAGSAVSVPANPVGQSSSAGQALSDLVFDVTRFSSFSSVIDIVFDGQDPGVALTGAQNYYGLYIQGALQVIVTGCVFRNFPNTACIVRNVRRATIEDNIVENIGFSGVAGSSRNGFSNIGIYSTSQPTLNTDQWLIQNNRVFNVIDVSIQYALTRGMVISGNILTGAQQIGIEGEANSFAVADTNDQLAAAGITGIQVPGDCVISNNFIDGTLSNGTLGMSLGAISAADGNDCRKLIVNNQIRNVSAQAIKTIVPNGGRVTIEGNDCFAVNQSLTQQGIYAVADEVTVSNNRLVEYGQDHAIGASCRGLMLRVTANECYLSAPPTTGGSAVISAGSDQNGSPTIVVEDNLVDNCPTMGIYINSNGTGNVLSPPILSVCRNKIHNHNRSGQSAGPAIMLNSISGSVLNAVAIRIDDNVIVETPLRTPTGSAPIVLQQNDTVAPAKLSISRNIGIGYTVPYTTSAMTTAPGSVIADGNSLA